MSTDAMGALKSAFRRAVAMGKAHGWRKEFDAHRLAPVVDNYTAMIDCELQEPDPDFTSIMQWIGVVADRVNRFCDDAKVDGDQAAEYWLERFLWRVDSVAMVGVLLGIEPSFRSCTKSGCQ